MVGLLSLNTPCSLPPHAAASIARSISEILSSGNGLQNNAGLDKFCRNYDFAYRMPGTGANAAALGRRIQQGEWVDMTVTSVRGHVMEHDFPDTFKKWHQVDPSALFTAPIVTRVSTVRWLQSAEPCRVAWLTACTCAPTIAFRTPAKSQRTFRRRYVAPTCS